jgi:hypothetical protein
VNAVTVVVDTWPELFFLAAAAAALVVLSRLLVVRIRVERKDTRRDD